MALVIVGCTKAREKKKTKVGRKWKLEWMRKMKPCMIYGTRPEKFVSGDKVQSEYHGISFALYVFSKSLTACHVFAYIESLSSSSSSSSFSSSAPKGRDDVGDRSCSELSIVENVTESNNKICAYTIFFLLPAKSKAILTLLASSYRYTERA